PLRRPSIREHHGLLFEVTVESLDAVLLAEAGLFGTAERQLVVRDLDVVDPRVPGLEQLGGLAGFREILRPDRRPKAVDARVRLRDRLVEVLHDEDRERRAED